MFVIGVASPADLTADELLDRIDALRPKYVEITSRIWRWAEVGYKEVQSSSLLADDGFEALWVAISNEWRAVSSLRTPG